MKIKEKLNIKEGMKTLEEIRKTLEENKKEIEKNYGVEIIGIFGSFAKGEQKEGSDVDILVELKRPIGFKFFELWDYLENLLGIKIDLLTPNALEQKPLLWESIKESLVYV